MSHTILPSQSVDTVTMPTSPLAFGSPPGYALSSWAQGQGLPAAVDPQEISTDDTSDLIWHKIAEEEMWTEKRKEPTNEPWALELAEVDRGTAKKKKSFQFRGENCARIIRLVQT